MAKKNGDPKKEIVVAIDKDKGSQYALKYAAEQYLTKGQTVTLIHVSKPGSVDSNSGDPHDVFVPFRCFCTRREIKCHEVLVENHDVAKGIIEYVTSNCADVVIIGAAKPGGIVRFKITDIPSNVTKGVPDFCSVYVIAKGKVSSVRQASRPPPPKPTSSQTLLPHNFSGISDQSDTYSRSSCNGRDTPARGPTPPRRFSEDTEIKSPFNRVTRPALAKAYEAYTPDSDISYVSSGRASSEHMFPTFYESPDSSGIGSRLSNGSEYDYRGLGGIHPGNKSFDISSQSDYSMSSQEDFSSRNLDDMEAEMRRLKLELKQTMDMYSSACKEALTAKQRARELHLWKLEEQQRIEEARLAEEAALALVEKEKAKCKAAIEAAEAAQRIAELEAQKRRNAEMKALQEAEERKKALQTLQNGDVRYRRYVIEEIEAATQDFADSMKIGEGGYGPVYKGFLDHTPVAIKVLRPDAAQGQSQFQQEVEVLSRIRHPYMVLLLGACPEYGCLVYEYMACGSLEDRLFRRGNAPPLPWQVRFRISAEIATALLFLHQTKPEPIVHRDLKPGNILLDRNLVSKISDVGLARLIPPSVANTVTQYRMTSTAGTFCYIDPEYQQTGMLGTKSDIYSLGVMLLQIITAKSPMGLTHHVERAVQKGALTEMLDPDVPQWPMEDTLKFAKLALRCTELRRKDRPDLGKEILPELDRLRALAEDNMPSLVGYGIGGLTSQSYMSSIQDMSS